MMKCPWPTRLYKKNKANRYKEVPCGKCGACRHNRRADWAFRMSQEAKQSTYIHFITLTYSDEKLPYTSDGEVTLEKSHLTNFFKRLRQENKKYSDEKIRYYAVGEYGSKTDRPHYHIALYNCHPNAHKRITSIWGNGHAHSGTLEPASIFYVAKFHVNASKKKKILVLQNLQRCHATPE